MPTTPSPSAIQKLIATIHLGRQVTAKELADAQLELEVFQAVDKGAKEVLWAHREYGQNSGDMTRALKKLADGYNIHK